MVRNLAQQTPFMSSTSATDSHFSNGTLLPSIQTDFQHLDDFANVHAQAFCNFMNSWQDSEDQLSAKTYNTATPTMTYASPHSSNDALPSSNTEVFSFCPGDFQLDVSDNQSNQFFQPFCDLSGHLPNNNTIDPALLTMSDPCASDEDMQTMACCRAEIERMNQSKAEKDRRMDTIHSNLIANATVDNVKPVNARQDVQPPPQYYQKSGSQEPSTTYVTSNAASLNELLRSEGTVNSAAIGGPMNEDRNVQTLQHGQQEIGYSSSQMTAKPAPIRRNAGGKGADPSKIGKSRAKLTPLEKANRHKGKEQQRRDSVKGEIKQLHEFLGCEGSPTLECMLNAAIQRLKRAMCQRETLKPLYLKAQQQVPLE